MPGFGRLSFWYEGVIMGFGFWYAGVIIGFGFDPNCHAAGYTAGLAMTGAGEACKVGLGLKARLAGE